MTNTLAALEIRIYLQDGHITRFDQTDPVIALRILESIHPSHLFTAPQLLIGSDHALTAFQPHLVVRIDLVTDLRPSWSSSSLALNTREIAEDEFKARCHLTRDVQPLHDEEAVVFGVWEMVNGERIFMQTHMTGLEEKRLPVEVGLLVQRVMTSGGLLARGEGAGYIVLNPACMLRFTSYVGLQEMPANALPMKRLTD